MKAFRIKRKPKHPEDDLQVTLAEWLDRFLPKDVRWWHVPNGGKRDPFEAARFKKMGVKAGVVDNHFVMPDGTLAVIELKIKPNRPTPEQETFLAEVSRRGGYAACCYSLDETLETLNTWLGDYGMSIRLPPKTTPTLEARVRLARKAA